MRGRTSVIRGSNRFIPTSQPDPKPPLSQVLLRRTRLLASAVAMVLCAAAVQAATITVDPGSFHGPYFPSGLPSVSGVQTLSVTPGSYSIKVGSTLSGAQLRFDVDSGGNISNITPAEAASASGSTLTFNTAAVRIEPGSYTGSYVPTWSGASLSGIQSDTIVTGLTFFVRVGATIDTAGIFFKLDAAGNVDPSSISPSSAARAAGSTLQFNNVQVAIDPQYYTGRYIRTWAGDTVSGPTSATLVPGLEFYVRVGTSLDVANLYFTPSSSGVGGIKPAAAAQANGSTVTFNNATVNIVPVNYTNEYFPSWTTASSSFTGQVTQTLVPGITFTMKACGGQELLFTPDSTGRATPDPQPLQSCAGAYFTFHPVTTLQIDPNGYTGEYALYVAGGPLLRDVSTGGGATQLLDNGSYQIKVGRYDAALIAFSVSGGQVSVQSGSAASATASGSTLTFITAPVAISPGSYTGKYLPYWPPSIQDVQGYRQYTLVRGLTYQVGIGGRGQGNEITFSVDGSGNVSSVSPAMSGSPSGSTLALNSREVLIEPVNFTGTYQFYWEYPYPGPTHTGKTTQYVVVDVPFFIGVGRLGYPDTDARFTIPAFGQLVQTATTQQGQTVRITVPVPPADTTPPVITVTGDNPMTVECHSSFTDPGATAVDDVAGNMTVSSTGSVNADRPGTYTINYTATDGINTANATRTVNVVDTTPPAITLVGDSSPTVECHSSFTDPGATATDICAGAVTVNVTGTVDVNAPGTYTLTYAATDGTNSAMATRTVKVVDTIPPAITLSGNSTVTVECHSSFTDPGATASDNCAGDLAVNVTGTVNLDSPGTYTLTYTATDGTNIATATRTVKVEDTSAPAITLNGDSTLIVECHDPGYQDPGATAVDACAGSLPVNASGNVNVNTPGTYILTYTATDGTNSAMTIRTVKVVDTTPPVITLSGNSTLTVECHSGFTDPGATAADNCAGSLPVTTTGGVDPNTPGTYTLTYTATDPSGNPASVTRTVRVVDTTAPVVSCPGPQTLTATCAAGQPGAVLNYTATAADACAGALPVSASRASGSTLPIGRTTVTCSAADGAGNTGTCSFDVLVTYDWSGFLQPINAGGSRSVFKLGSTVPVKFALTGASACVTNATARLSYQLTSSADPGPVNEADSTSAATTDNLFRYDASSGQYIFNWSTKNLSVGTYRLYVDLGDGVQRTVDVGLK